LDFIKNIEEYEDYKVIDFVEDEIFRKWILEEDESYIFYWDKIFDTYPNLKTASDEARQILTGSKSYFDSKSTQVKEHDAGFQTMLEDHLEKVVANEKPELKNKRFILFWKIAASIAFIVSLSSLLYTLKSDDTLKYSTSNGEWKNIELPDGSIVELNANSQLSLNNGWDNGNERVVWLKGEGFFRVKKKVATHAKFSVITEDLRVEVYGTAFNVNTRNEKTKVFLEEGKVLLKLDEKNEEIVPGEYLCYSQGKKKIIDRGIKTGGFQSDWKKGVLKIEEASIGQILDEIETIYGIDIIVNDSSLKERIGTVAFPVDNLLITTTILERALNVKVEIKGKQIFIEKINNYE
jgi:transmembrane sensor